MVLSNDNSSRLVWMAFIVVILAAVVAGIVIGNNLKPSSTTITSSAKYADITLTVQSDLTLGPDNNTHDSFVPCNFTVYAGQIVNLTVVNYDRVQHSFTSTTLNVNFQIPASQENGVPSISQFQFTPTQAGVYRWYCNMPCDTDSGGWAMTTGSDGQPDQIGYMGGFVTVLQK
jgi:plastocyanin